jgi:glycosyltransferase involved in cell wall biosynthesis
MTSDSLIDSLSSSSLAPEALTAPGLSVLPSDPATAGLAAPRAPTWIVLDTRTAERGVNSGVARFVAGLAGGLAHVLESQPFPRPVRILLVGKHEPHAWIIGLVQRYPDLVSYWSGGPGALSRKSDRPIWLWPSRVVAEIAHKTDEHFFWVAPGNFDRPLLWPFGRARWRNRIVQVVHDTIPFTQKASMGLLFRAQFCGLVKRTLSSFPHVLTVSPHSAKELADLAPKRQRPVDVVGNGIEPVFGSYAKVMGEDRVQARLRFLSLLFPQAEEASQREFFERLARARWVVGVGRYQKYKAWETAEEAVGLLQGSLREGAWFFRVGLGAKDTQRLSRTEQHSLALSTVFPGLQMLGLPELSDALLGVLYTLADVCAHPSRAEGFGLPPLEAAFCGTPVVYRAGTAVDDHFSHARLPEGFVTALADDSAQAWARALLKAMEDADRPATELGAFARVLVRAEDARSEMSTRLGGDRYDWRVCAQRFLASLFGNANSLGAAP